MSKIKTYNNRRCIVRSCPYYRSKVPENIGDISFFKLPDDEARTQEWLKLCNRLDLTDVTVKCSKTAYICNLHFAFESMNRKRNRLIIANNTKPSLNLDDSNNIMESNQNVNYMNSTSEIITTTTTSTISTTTINPSTLVIPNEITPLTIPEINIKTEPLTEYEESLSQTDPIATGILDNFLNSNQPSMNNFTIDDNMIKIEKVENNIFTTPSPSPSPPLLSPPAPPLHQFSNTEDDHKSFQSFKPISSSPLSNNNFNKIKVIDVNTINSRYKSSSPIPPVTLTTEAKTLSGTPLTIVSTKNTLINKLVHVGTTKMKPNLLNTQKVTGTTPQAVHTSPNKTSPKIHSNLDKETNRLSSSSATSSINSTSNTANQSSDKIINIQGNVKNINNINKIKVRTNNMVVSDPKLMSEMVLKQNSNCILIRRRPTQNMTVQTNLTGNMIDARLFELTDIREKLNNVMLSKSNQDHTKTNNVTFTEFLKLCDTFFPATLATFVKDQAKLCSDDSSKPCFTNSSKEFAYAVLSCRNGKNAYDFLSQIFKLPPVDQSTYKTSSKTDKQIIIDSAIKELDDEIFNNKPPPVKRKHIIPMKFTVSGRSPSSSSSSSPAIKKSSQLSSSTSNSNRIVIKKNITDETDKLDCNLSQLTSNLLKLPKKPVITTTTTATTPTKLTRKTTIKTTLSANEIVKLLPNLTPKPGQKILIRRKLPNSFRKTSTIPAATTTTTNTNTTNSIKSPSALEPFTIIKANNNRISDMKRATFRLNNFTKQIQQPEKKSTSINPTTAATAPTATKATAPTAAVPVTPVAPETNTTVDTSVDKLNAILSKFSSPKLASTSIKSTSTSASDVVDKPMVKKREEANINEGRVVDDGDDVDENESDDKFREQLFKPIEFVEIEQETNKNENIDNDNDIDDINDSDNDSISDDNETDDNETDDIEDKDKNVSDDSSTSFIDVEYLDEDFEDNIMN